MPTRIQIKVVTKQIKYLEEKIQVLEPTIELMKNVVTKSKAWLEEKTDQSSVSYIELSQELDTAATALLDVTSHISDEDNKDVNKPTPSLPQPDTQTTATFLAGESTRQLKTQVQHTAVEEHPDLERRLAYIETTLSSLQDTQHKSTDDISEIKKWRDNFVTEQSDNWVNIEQLTKKQKQNFKNIRKQIIEQDNKVKELNKDIESLNEKESKSNETLEKLSLDMKRYENNLRKQIIEQDNKVKELNKDIESLNEKESKSNEILEKMSLVMKGFENNLHKINKDMQDYTDKTDSMTQEIKRHSDLMAALQEECNKILCNTSTQLKKQNVLYKLLQQRLMPIDRLIQIFNQNLETREEKTTKLETIEATISVLSKDLNLLESRVCNRYACYVQLADPTPVSAGSTISTFSEVREYNGQHFNQTTGTFVSPHDGLYLVCVSLHEWGDKHIQVPVVAGDEWCKSIEVKCAGTSSAGSVVVDMKKGQELYFYANHADQGAALSWFSSFTIVSL
ncbi:repetitive organellar protein-like [Physella acuta]|uniref:repetitive organellar protein-like n=1 Tax=Physella acuta TaxID=109671 RepID=UPI0027DEAA22|nr:repetitive organellar protein-like [Physella acuta]